MHSDCVNQWQQEGKLHIWRYKHAAKRRNAGLHFNADKVATGSLLQLLNCLGEEIAGVRTIRLQQPTQAVSIPGFSGEAGWFEKLRLAYEKGFEGTEFSIDGQKLDLEIGASGALKMAQALECYREGEYDFSLPCTVNGGGTYDRSVWFW